MAACSTEITLTPEKENPVFTASLAPAETKTGLEGLDVLWTAVDEIAIVDASGTKVLYTTAEGGATSATFTRKEGETGSLSEGPYTAWYPAGIAEGYLPATQVYTWDNTESRFAEVQAPMRAVSASTTLQFKNLCGLVKLNLSTGVSGANVKRIMLTANEGMSGEFTVNSENAAVAKYTNPVSSLMAYAVGISASPRSFYIYVPEGDYTDFRIRLDSSGNTKTQTLRYKGSAFHVERNQIVPVDLSLDQYVAPTAVTGGLCLVFCESERACIATTGGDISWTWAPGTLAFSDMDEVKPVLYNGEECLLVTSNAGGVALLRIADKSLIFQINIPEDGPHSAELLPDGKVVVACATAGKLRVYAVDGTLASEVTCSSAHNAVWSKYDGHLWAADETRLIRFGYAGGILSEDSSYALPSTGAHDLYPVYGENALWLSTNLYVHKFDLSAARFIPVSMIYAPNVKSVCSGPRPSYPTLVVTPESGSFRSQKVQTSAGAIAYSVGTDAATAIYKARWLLFDSFPPRSGTEQWSSGPDVTDLFGE